MPNPEKDKSPPLVAPPFRPSHILVHYDELILKGRNRSVFEKCLHSNVRRALRDAGKVGVTRRHGRIIVELGPDADIDACLRRLSGVFGVIRYSPALTLPLDLAAIERWLGAQLEGLEPRHFAIACRRANKKFPLSSVEVNRRLGRYVQESTGWPVRIKKPDLTVHVHLLDDAAWVGFERLAGPGGLPTGSAGKVVSLISGGIDSPVATYQMLRRGCQVVFAHFHSFPHTDEASQHKVRELVMRILPYGHAARLYLVPFAATQQRIVTECPAPLRVVLYRRFMLRAAEAIARAEGALATVTGDSLGQVASQTLENLHSISRVAELPVLRPLVGSNKQHIVELARQIGTYEISIEPHDDCCSFLMPRNPATHSTPEEVERAEASLDVAAEIERLLEESTDEELSGEDW